MPDRSVTTVGLARDDGISGGVKLAESRKGSRTHTDCGGERLHRQQESTDERHAGKAGQSAEQVYCECQAIARVAKTSATVTMRCAAERALVTDDNAVRIGGHDVGLRRRAMPICSC